MKTNYQSFVDRIATENTYDGLKKLDRLYSAGIFSVPEFKRLDTKILNKLVDMCWR